MNPDELGRHRKIPSWNASAGLTATPKRRTERGSAAVEFIVMAPFILAMMALVWDLRQYIAYHTEVAREMFAAAEVIANQTDASDGQRPIPLVVSRAMDRLARAGAGTVSVILVTRGNRRDANAAVSDTACDGEGTWCLPMVAAQWPTADNPELGAWNGGGDCSDNSASWPTPGNHVNKSTRVMPNEGAADGSAAVPHDQWLSRNMRHEEWWVVIDTCFHPNPRQFGFGRMVIQGLEFFDASAEALVFSKRAVWGSVHDYSACAWCS